MTGPTAGVDFQRVDIGDFLLVESLRAKPWECSVSFVDIEAGLLGKADEVGCELRPVAPMLGFAEPAGTDGFVLGAGQKLGFVSPNADAQWSQAVLPSHQRFNDATIDSLGRLVVGSLSLAPIGADSENQLFVLENDGTLNVIRDAVGLSNGIAVEPLTGDLFHVDTVRATIHRMSLDSASGRYGGPELVHKFGPSENPDGLILLESGELVVALWGHGALAVIDPSRGEVERLSVPPSFPTSVCICNTCGELWMGSASQPRDFGPMASLPGAVWKSTTTMRQVPSYSWEPLDIKNIELGSVCE